MSEAPTPPRTTKTVTPQPAVVEAVPWWTSRQVQVALVTFSGGFLAFAHVLCRLKVLCVFEQVQALELATGLGGLIAMGGAGWWIWKRVKIGRDPTNTAAPLTLK